MDMSFESLFHDDHGRAFADALSRLHAEIGEAKVEHILECIIGEADDFGEARGPEPGKALRLLALDGYLTEMLGSALTGNDRPDLRTFTQILAGDAPRSADN